MSGIVVGLVEPDGRRRVIGYGASCAEGPPLNGGSIFEIGSVTKVFTGVLLADAVRRGEVQFTQPVADLLPNVWAPSRSGKQITLLDLATHTSGLAVMPPNFPKPEDASAYAGYSVEQLYQSLSTFELERDPGASDAYSNYLALLGHALARGAKKSYVALLRERVLAPLGMRGTLLTPAAPVPSRRTCGHDLFGDAQPDFVTPAFAPSGGLRSSLDDMLLFALANLSESDTGLYAALKASHRPRRPLGNSGEFWGLGWGVDTKAGVVGHSGQTFGYNSFINIDLKRRRAVVVLSNTAGNNANALGVHLLDPAESPLPKPSIGGTVAAAYRSNGLDKALERFRTLRATASHRWSFGPSELNSVGYWLLRRKTPADAVAVFLLNAEAYPEDPNVHDSLAEGFAEAGLLQQALASSRKAVALAESTGHQSLSSYRATLVRLVKQNGEHE